jgi:ABC-2 type transport system permease protein
VPLTPALAWVPLLVVIQFLFTLGLSLGLSAVNVYFRDIQHIVDALMLPWFFLTPIAYTFPATGNPVLYQLALVLNPMASLVTAYRQAIYFGGPPDLDLLAITAAEAVVVMLVGALLFRRLSPNFSDEL